MSLFLHRRSIRNKLSLVVILVSLVVLLAGSFLFGVIEYTSYRQKAVGEMTALTGILSVHLTKPLMGKKALEADRVLSALSSDKRLYAAYLFDQDFHPMAQYLDARYAAAIESDIKADFPNGFPSSWQHADTPVSRFSLKHLSLYTPIGYQNNTIGGLYLIISLKELNQRIAGLLVAVLLAGGAAIGLAWFLAGWIQKPISEPILQLADTMQRISDTGNYRLRGEKISQDEIGQLVDGFNDMLTQIELRDAKIDAHQKYLEQAVADRTLALSQTIQDLEKAREQADSANQAKSAFLANMTHELRTPLVGVLGMNELLLESDLNEQQLGLAETVQRSGDKLLELINEILDFSHFESGKVGLRPEKTDIVALVEEVVESYVEDAWGKGLELVCKVDPNAAWSVNADPKRLKQLLTYLLSNALKFTHQGSFGLSLTSTNENRFDFEVWDTGIGIEDSKQEEILHAFSQADSSTSRVFGGAGLGLTVVHKLVQLMDGQLTIESRPGEGSRFRVSLPLRRFEPLAYELPQDLLNKSFFVYEPRTKSRNAFIEMFMDLGLRVVGTASIDEALQRLHQSSVHQEPFDFVLIAEESNGQIADQLLDAARDNNSTVVCVRRGPLGDSESSCSIEVRSPLFRSHVLKGEVFRSQETTTPVIAPVPETVVEQHKAEPQGDSGRLLVVDDNVSTRELITLSLRGTKWLIDEASCADEAEAAAMKKSYDLILMDVNMPGVDGLEATRRLREKGVKSPVYALTAHGDDVIFNNCLDAGMQGVLRKPFRQKELFSLLQSQFNQTADKSELLSEVGG